MKSLPHCSLLVVAVGVLAAVGSTTESACAHDNDPALPGWRLVWHDEFDGDTLDLTKWTPLDREKSFNDEKQYYRPDRVTVSDGELRLTAVDEPYGSKEYQSGIVTSKRLFGHGRFEARIVLPTTQGMWPAFWLNANHVQWPQGGEIDIMENRGDQPRRTSAAYHWQKDPGPCCEDHQFVFRSYHDAADGKPVDFSAGFHTYAAEWDEESIRFFVDGNQFFHVTPTEDRPIIATEKNLIINLAVGGKFGGDPDETTVFPQTIRIDYVRHWVRDE
ncbi:MAG: glycoside hydrolase family 16 protein [Planctomycetota bacterium]